MFELKKGMKFIDEKGKEREVLELGKSSFNGETIYIFEIDSRGGSSGYCSKGINWEETAKLNFIDLDFIEWDDKVGKILKEIDSEEYERNLETYKNIVGNGIGISISELKQKKEQLRQDIYDLLTKFEEETTVKVKSLELKDKITDGYGYGDMKLRELIIELEV